MPSHAFDAAAGDYDREFTDSQPGRWFREIVWHHVGEQFEPGGRVLDLGCGTGEDAVFMAHAGLRVLAVDMSAGMIAAARRKAVAAGVEAQIRFVQGDLAFLAESSGASCDGALSDFGPLNCIEDLGPVAETLARRLRPGAPALLVVMGPWCPWEVLWYLLRGRIPTALRRLRRGVEAPVGGGKTIAVWYHSPRALARAFRPFFERHRLVGIGSLLPPPYLSGLVAKAPRFFGWLARLDRRLGRFFPFTRLNDHYLMVMRRRA